MSQFLDGVSSSATQNGPKQISLPLKADGNYYATKVSRNYIASPADSYSPILGQRTAYTSLLKYSDDFSQANWVKVNTTGAVTSAVYDPEGGVTASKVAEDATGGAIAHNVSQVLACAAGATPFGVFARAAERSFIRLRLYNATDGSLGNAVFNLGTGVLVSGTGEIKKLLYGWYWCYITPTAAVTNSTLFVDIGSDATTFSYAGTAGSGVYLWRATAYLAAAMGPAIATTSTTPTAVTAPPVDKDDPIAFVVDEQECDTGALEVGIARWNRQYANVPRATVVPNSLAWVTPQPIPVTGTNRLYGTVGESNCGMFYQPDSAQDRFQVYSRKAISTDEGVANTPTGGTYNMQFGAVTSGALSYATTAGALKTALNAMSSVTAYGSISTVTGAYTDAAGFLATFNDYATGSLDATAIEYGAGENLVTNVVASNNGWTQDFAISIANGTMPSPSGSVSGINLVGYAATPPQQWDEYLNTRKIYFRQDSSSVVTGGYSTITLWGQTANINWNATITQFLAALNALSNVTAHGSVYAQAGFSNYDTSARNFMGWIPFGDPIITGGHYHVTLFGQTTGAIAYNASIADISTAINALSEVTARGGCVVSGNGFTGGNGATITFTVTFSASVMSGNSSLTPTPGSVICTVVAATNGRQQTIKLTASQASRLLTFSLPHGLASGDAIYVLQNATYFYLRTDWTYISANQISVNPANAPWSTNTAFTYAGKFQGYYSPGATGFATQETTTYWLPGFTAGIATVADLPLMSRPISDINYLDAIVAGAATVPYSESSLAPWLGPIIKRTLIELKTILAKI